MYKFYYDYLKSKYGDKCKLLFTDTDSLCCHIQTGDLYADMAENIEHFDTINFETTHPLYSLQNHRVLGKFKSETGSLALTEFVGLRAKMYSLYVPNSQTKIRAKGIKKSYIKKHARHQQFLNVLQTKQITKSHFLYIIYYGAVILDYGIGTLPYGHSHISP